MAKPTIWPNGSASGLFSGSARKFIILSITVGFFGQVGGRKTNAIQKTADDYPEPHRATGNDLLSWWQHANLFQGRTYAIRSAYSRSLASDGAKPPVPGGKSSGTE